MDEILRYRVFAFLELWHGLGFGALLFEAVGTLLKEVIWIVL